MMIELLPGIHPAAGWILICLAALVVGVTKTGIPGIGILAVVSLASVMEAKQSVGFLLPMLVTGDIFAVAYYRRHAQWDQLLRLMPSAAIGIGIGYFLLGIVESSQLRPIIGVIVLTLLVLDCWRNCTPGEPPVPDHWMVAVLVGAAAGITTMLANAAGPLIVLYFIAMRFEKKKFIGTAAWYFLTLNLVKVPLFWSRGMITTASLTGNAIVAPVVLAGAVLGVFVLKRIPQKWFVRVARIIALGGAVNLLLS